MSKPAPVARPSSPPVVAERSDELYGGAWLLFIQLLLAVGFVLTFVVNAVNPHISAWFIGVPLVAAFGISVGMVVRARLLRDRFIWTLVGLISAAIFMPLVFAALHVHV